ncbi:hypothetical protein [Mariniluteicoccus flavus]
MTPPRPPVLARWWVRVFLAALVAVWAVLGLATTASAATEVGAENRVRASSITIEVPVEPPEGITPSQQLGNNPCRTVTTAATGVAANGGERLLWTSWQNYPKVTQGGREYAQIGDRLYSHHAVDRLQPSGLGAPAGATGAGRSVSPNFVEDVLGSTKGVPVKGPNGEARLSFTSGTVQVITEDSIVITVITR